MWDGIVDGIKEAINWIIGGINTFIRGLNKVKVPDWVPGIGGKGINIPQIPRLAKGGNIEQSGMALVGEAGPEVLHLPKGAQVSPLEKTVEKDVTLNINLSGLPAGIDEESIKQFLLRALREPEVARRVDEALYNNTRSRLAPQGAF